MVINQYNKMARTKKQLKAKEPIKIRFKQLTDGNVSIYLDIYYQGKRSYEFLKMYLVPEVDKASKEQNLKTLQCVEAIKGQRINDLYNGKADINKNGFEKMLLIDFLNLYIDSKIKSGKSKSYIRGIARILPRMEAYNAGAMLKDIDRNFCLGFIEHLKTAKNIKHAINKEKTITSRTARAYFDALNSALIWGVKKGYLNSNPCELVDTDEKIKAPESTREYLTKEEVKTLIDAPCINDSVKQAYLFSCFCGLRYSDVSSLTWGEVINEDGRTKVKTIMQKTKRVIYVPLGGMALTFMPAKPVGAKDNDKVFAKLPSLAYINIALKQWAKSNGINKVITFHTSRHTFATTLLQGNADLYTVSKLLGHTKITTTQIYAKIVDKAKEEAIDGLDKLFN